MSKEYAKEKEIERKKGRSQAESPFFIGSRKVEHFESSKVPLIEVFKGAQSRT